MLSSFVADDGQVEHFVVVSACGEHRAIAQSRCLGLTGTDIHIYMHTYIQTGDDNASRLLASPFGSAMKLQLELFTLSKLAEKCAKKHTSLLWRLTQVLLMQVLLTQSNFNTNCQAVARVKIHEVVSCSYGVACC